MKFIFHNLKFFSFIFQPYNQILTEKFHFFYIFLFIIKINVYIYNIKQHLISTVLKLVCLTHFIYIINLK